MNDLEWLEELKNSPKGSVEYNKYLSIMYPYLTSRNPSGKMYDDYEDTVLDEVPDGWKDLVLQMCDELNTLLDKYNVSDISEFYFSQIKEKFGRLQIYYVGVPEIIHNEFLDLIDKYSMQSTRICVKCGKPAKYYTQGYVRYYCEEHTPSTKYIIGE